MRSLRRWAGELVDLVLPVECLGCAAAGIAWCEPCREAAGQLRIHAPDPAPAGFPPTVAAATYADDVRLAILGAKDHGRRDLIAPLAQLLGWSVAAAVPGGGQTILVPMPSTPANARARGGSHMVRMASLVARADGHVLVEALQVRDAHDATSLGAAGRLADRRRTMGVRRRAADLLQGKDVVLVDDVVTTGATLAVATSLVGRWGARSVRAAVVAATEKEVTRK